jgi:porphobilinogen synthase
MLRPRRLRSSEKLREMIHEVDLSLSQLIQPYFLAADKKAQEPITGFSNVYRWGVDSLSKKIESDLERGIHGFLLFGGATDKDEMGSGSGDPQALIPQALRTLRARFGKSILLFSDVCLCPYTSHGHCGVLEGDEIHNDASLTPLAKMALIHAEAGADFVAPSDMMDGRIGFIRETLDASGKENVGILAYTAKYASSYYGPFREALDSAPKGDRATYQMDFRNRTEALRELELDLNEGADLVMVKPALAYLDVIRAFKEISTVPVVAYSVSGEYEMVKALVAKGMADERKMTVENLTAIRRAGANIIITYSASEIAEKGWL